MEASVMREAIARLADELELPVELPEEAEGSTTAHRTHEEALLQATRETGIDLGTSRVRVGFTRGHLLEIVVQVPLDVSGDDEKLQLSAEIYLEERVGTSLLDTWVADVSVDRIARTRGLVMVADPKNSQSAHLLEEAKPLIERGVQGVEYELPRSLLVGDRARSDWTALEIPPLESGFQADRRYASTWHPEALKCALEGMPFSSCRFTRGPEILAWIRWSAEASEREATKTQVEKIVDAQATGVALCGTGFGAHADYLDLWCDLEEPTLSSFLRRMNETVGFLEFGLYESAWRDWSLSLGRPPAFPE